MPKPGVEYVVAMASNAVLNRKAEEAMEVARLLAGLTDQTEHVYDEVRYAAGSWKQERRVIIKAEVVRADHKEPKDNPRFVITNMKQTPQWLYEEVYCQRGEIENRIKELHAMQIDRTSCTRFWANQFRVLLTAAAYVLMQELRLSAASNRLRKGASLDTAGTLPETGCAGDPLGAAHGRASAAIISVSGDLPAHGPGTGSIAWVERTRSTEEYPSCAMTQPTTRESPCPRNRHPDALRTPTMPADTSHNDNLMLP